MRLGDAIFWSYVVFVKLFNKFISFFYGMYSYLAVKPLGNETTRLIITARGST